MRILVTGAAGFIGSNLVNYILTHKDDAEVVGVDSINEYYDVTIKKARLSKLQTYSKFRFLKGNIAQKNLINEVFADFKPQIVVNLAAQAGVRYSIINPDAYIESKLIGVYSNWEGCRDA